MYKNKIAILILLVAMVLLLSACSEENEVSEPDITTLAAGRLTTTAFQGSDSLKGAMEWYLYEKAAYQYPSGDHYSCTYRVLGTDENEGKLTVYTMTLVEWTAQSGKKVSGGSNFTVIVYKINDAKYIFEKATNYTAQQISSNTEIPTKIQDAYKNQSYDKAMRLEIDKDIQKYLKSNQ
ncbi:MAG: hypothetical protein BGN88_10385 [Clostridiales bacterium 43-6]|nr:MAG: hypothetical protein BGN88_10385 [Clostridiales bacterium 43-6]